MKDRLPKVPLHRFGPAAEPAGLFVIYQVFVPVAPEIVSQTRVVAASRWPQPVVAPAASQSSPPGMPPWKRLMGRINDWRSLPHRPFRFDQLAPEAVQLVTQRLIPPLLLPSQKRRLVPVPIGSIWPENPSPPKPICHCTGPVGLPVNVTELGPLSCAPPTACGVAEVAKLPLMSPE